MKRDLLSFNQRIYLNKRNDSLLTIFMNGIKDLNVKGYVFVFAVLSSEEGGTMYSVQKWLSNESILGALCMIDPR